ncbi:hypothetical protein ACWCPD_16255 [Streptomyces sp. NPDC001935]
MGDYDRLEVRKFGAVVPVTAEQLLDAGLPLPPGMVMPPAPPRPPWHRRMRRACSSALLDLRERVGFWIAGYRPDDEDW